MDVTFNYEPLSQKIKDFHASPARDRCLIGGFGSGKTHAAMAEAIMLAMEFPKNEIDICRQTFGELDRSTRLTFQELCPKQIVARPYSSQDHQIHLINGSVIQFFPLDDTEKVKSLNSGCIIVDEASEIREEMFVMLRARLRRPVPRRCSIVVSNPTNTNHWLYRWFGATEHPDRFLRKLSTYENPLLPKDYVADLERNLSKEMFQIYVMGEWGHISFGERVFPNFGPSLHLGDTTFRSELPVIRGWDFGYYHPAVVFLQIDEKGRVRVHAELMGNSRIIEHFAEDVLRMSERQFPGAKFEDYGDPAGDRIGGGGVSTDTATRILNDKFGINVRSRRTLVKDGLDLIRRLLDRNEDGQPNLVINKERCKILAEGFLGGYACSKDRDGNIIKDQPVEDGYFEHTQDALRYALVNKLMVDLKSYKDINRKRLPDYKPTFVGTSW